MREPSDTVYQQLAGKFIRYNVALARLPGVLCNDMHTSTLLPFIFFHIPKTAGSIVRVVLHSLFDDQDLAPLYNFDDYEDPEQIAVVFDAGFRLFTGHMDIVARNRIRELAGPTTTVTFLRDPISRVVSNAAFEGLHPADFLSSPYGSDLQARLLCGWSEQVDDRRAREALAGMTFGLFEDLERSFDLISHAFRLPHTSTPGPRLNASGADHDISADMRSAIAGRSEHDIRLVEFARVEFEQRFRSAFGESTRQQRRDQLDRAYRDAVFAAMEPYRAVELRADRSWPGLGWGLRGRNGLRQTWRTVNGQATLFMRLHANTSYIVSVHVHSAPDVAAIESLTVCANGVPLEVAGHGIINGVPVRNWLIPTISVTEALEISFRTVSSVDISLIQVYPYSLSTS